MGLTSIALLSSSLTWTIAATVIAAQPAPQPPDSLTCLLGVHAPTRTQAGLTGEVVETRVRTFTLDLRDGRRVPVSENVSGVERRTYRPDGRLDTVEEAGGFDLVTYAYDASGRLATILRGGRGRPALAARTALTYAHDSVRLVDFDTAGRASLYRFYWPAGAGEVDEYVDGLRGPGSVVRTTHHVCDQRGRAVDRVQLHDDGRLAYRESNGFDSAGRLTATAQQENPYFSADPDDPDAERWLTHYLHDAHDAYGNWTVRRAVRWWTEGPTVYIEADTSAIDYRTLRYADGSGTASAHDLLGVYEEVDGDWRLYLYEYYVGTVTLEIEARDTVLVEGRPVVVSAPGELTVALPVEGLGAVFGYELRGGDTLVLRGEDGKARTFSKVE